MKENFADNQFQFILELSNVLNFSFFLPLAKRCAIIIYKHGVYEFAHKLPNDLKLSILGN